MSVELVLLCGFLGSGKTSLLVDYLQAATGNALQETGVIVNEVGEIGIDGAVISEASADLPMTLLDNGCVCCSLRSDLVHTVQALLDARRPAGFPPLARIVLETSGLSRPGPIIGSLADPALTGRGLKVSVLATWDCEHRGLQSEAFDEAAAQLAAARRIVLTKTDRVPEHTLADHAAAASAINPLAEIVADPDRAVAVKRAFASMDSGIAATAPKGWLSSAALGKYAPANRAQAHPRIHVSTATLEPSASWDEFANWLDDVAGFCGERLLRLKAVVTVADSEQPVAIQSVGTTFGAPRALNGAPPADQGIVLIVRDLDAGAIAAAMGERVVQLHPSTHR